MQARQKKDIAPFISPNGEQVFELLGQAVGFGEQHSLAHVLIPPGKSSDKHYHPEVEESYYILKGQAELIIDEETLHMQPGQAIAILPNQTHQIFNHSDEDLEFLAICAPGWTPECSVFV